MPARLSLIVATDLNNGIGANNQLLWHLPDDFKFFKSTTLNHPIIGGRKNFESIGRALPKRTNIVITRNTVFTAEGCVIKHNLPDAITHAHTIDQEEIFIIGGGEIYKQALPLADRVYLTRVDTTYDNANIFFPQLPPADWAETSRSQPHPQDEKHKHAFTFFVFDRKA